MKNNIKEKLTYVIPAIFGSLFIINFVYLLILQIQVSDLQAANIVALVITQILLVAVTIWTAFSSPSAVLAKIEKSKYIRELRIAHYANLDFYVITPLSELSAKSDSLDQYFNGMKIKYEIDNIKKSLSFDDAIRHLNIKYPNFKEDLNSLIDEVEQFNREIDRLENAIGLKIREEFSQEGINISEDLPIKKGTTYFWFVFRLIQDQWKIVIRIYKTEKPDDGILQQEILKLKPLEKNKRKDEFWLAGHWIANDIGEKQENTVENIIEKFSKDIEIIKQIIDLLEEKKRIVQKTGNIQTQCKDLADYIKGEKYYSIAECCEIPKLLSENEND